MSQAWLIATVSPGQFPTEYAVSGKQYNDHHFSLFAPTEKVKAPASGEGEGHILVDVVESSGNMVLVRLPAQTFEKGQYVTVHQNQLTSALIAAGALA